MDDQPVSARECAAKHESLGERLDSLQDDLAQRIDRNVEVVTSQQEGVSKKLDKVNGAVADNTKFRVQAQAILALTILLASIWGATALALLLG